MSDFDTKTVADAVTENIKTADVFKKYGIDFCCGGGITIKKASEKNKVDFNQLIKELNEVENKVSYLNDFDSWELDFLIDHIVYTHHKYVEESLTLLKQYGTKVAKVHGQHYSELYEIEKLIFDISDELTVHMKKEELILFPYIKKLVNAFRNDTSIETPHFGTVNNPIKMMENEHDDAGEAFRTIAKLTNNYQTPDEACTTFKALYAKLEEFQDDLHQHVHLENNILFPKAKQLEIEVHKE